MLKAWIFSDKACDLSVAAASLAVSDARQVNPL